MAATLCRAALSTDVSLHHAKVGCLRDRSRALGMNVESITEGASCLKAHLYHWKGALQGPVTAKSNPPGVSPAASQRSHKSSDDRCGQEFTTSVSDLGTIVCGPVRCSFLKDLMDVRLRFASPTLPLSPLRAAVF